MEKIKFILLLIFLTPIFNSFSAIQNGKTLKFNYNLADIKIDKNKSNNGFVTYNHKDLVLRKIEGRPMLPMTSIILKGLGDIKQIKTNLGGEKISLKGNLDFYKGTKCRCKDIEDVEFDYKVYGELEQEFNIEYFGDLRGEKIYKLNIPMAKQNGTIINFFEEVSIELPNNLEVIADFSNLLDNIQEEKTLIISTNEFKNLLNTYIANQSNRIFYIEEIDNSTSTSKIKKIINDYYQSKKITNVMLVGNQHIIPTFYVKTKFDSQTPSDLNYGLLGGNQDSLPDVFMSRLSVANNSELTTILEKLNKQLNGVNIKKIMGIASNEGSNPTDEEYMKQMMNPILNGKKAQGVFLRQNDTSTTKQRFNDLLEEGVNWINYIGHGSGFSWPSFNHEYFASDLDYVGEQNIYPILVDVACQNGNFSGDARLGESFMYGGKDHQSIGSSIYYGGSVDISWHPPAIMALGISEYVEKNSNFPIYKAFIYGHLYLMKNHSNKEDIVDNLEWYHLQGDPGVIIR